MKRVLTAALMGAGLAVLGACAREEAPAAHPEEEALHEEAAAVDYDAIIAGGDRSEADRARDADRKPAETLAFFEIKPGDDVFELEAGGGYFTEIYSLAVGPEGSVVMQNFQDFVDYAKDEIETRLADNRLANVRVSTSLHDNLDAEDDSMDVVTWVQGPHELYYREPADAPAGKYGDPEKSFDEIYRITKPGGVFGVIDHAAVDGAPTSTGTDLHRIDKNHVIEMATNAGFVLEAESDFLANPEDDRTTLVFAEEIRGKTDQFALRFRKPE